MPKPVIYWYDATNTTQLTRWDIGTVDAGSTSKETTFLIWNNRGGTTALSDIHDCTITTKDAAGGNLGELITNTWIEVRVDSMNEFNFAKVGGDTTKPVTAENAQPNFIMGLANDGNMATTATKQCFAKVTLRANIPATATAGNVSFLTRLAYQYS